MMEIGAATTSGLEGGVRLESGVDRCPHVEAYIKIIPPNGR
jgi:hypothetical protein